MPNTCIICGHIKSTKAASGVSMHRFPADPEKRGQWLTALGLKDTDIKEHSRICSRHFLYGDVATLPSLTIGKRFASPKKLLLDRGKRALQRRSLSPPFLSSIAKRPSLASSSSRSATPVNSDATDVTDESDVTTDPFNSTAVSSVSDSISDVALNARIEVLEAEIKQLRSELGTSKNVILKPFRIEDIASNDSLVKFYTGFVSYEVLLDFFHFLGPSVYSLIYWGSRSSQAGKQVKAKRKKKLTPLNQFFLTLLKLHLNLQIKDLANRFRVSVGLVSKYITTWICFLYHQLKEIDWVPTPQQVAATLPVSFKQEYPTTYAIIDASEWFIETPSDLHLQSSTWSSYKHHNTAKYLIACTPNGGISYVSPLYVGSISDVELTRISGFIGKLERKPGVSIMADRGFTIQDQLNSFDIKLNIPPFLEGKKQLPANEVGKGRKIASLRIHVERAIGRIKNYTILKGTLPLSMVRLANQIINVCAWLTNFQTVLVPLPKEQSEEDVDDYFRSLCDDSDYEGDCEGDEDCSEDGE